MPLYYPIQIPYILSKEFSESVRYSEETDSRLNDYVVCFWEMRPRGGKPKTVGNIIITDGCVDLVADFDSREIGFAGMSKTNFEFKINSESSFYGARMKPGAFHALTGLPATDAMDNFIPLGVFDAGFDTGVFFGLPFEEAKTAVREYIFKLGKGKKAPEFTGLFDALSGDIPDTAKELYERLHFSPKQTERLFRKHYGLTPQAVLSILRFQCCLKVLTDGNTNPRGAMELVNYYDQAHFIKDFKRNIGLTPLELVNKYR